MDGEKQDESPRLVFEEYQQSNNAKKVETLRNQLAIVDR
jgi:hypothetical protein